MTITLTQFLTARYDEIEDLASTAEHGDWYLDYADDGVCDHFEQQSPTYVLADIAAKCGILAVHPVDNLGYCMNCWSDRTPQSSAAPCPTLRHMSMPFVDHPDYRQEWRP